MIKDIGRWEKLQQPVSSVTFFIFTIVNTNVQPSKGKILSAKSTQAKIKKLFREKLLMSGSRLSTPLNTMKTSNCLTISFTLWSLQIGMQSIGLSLFWKKR